MPRPVRFILPGVAVHVIQRGRNGVACFRNTNDYLMYLAHLRQLARKYDCAVHAYCLMPDHVHLLLTPTAAGVCTALIRDVGRRYIRYFNDRHGCIGGLCEARVRSCLVQSARYVLGCYRYIESNSVRARIVDHPIGYLWSSYAVNAGMRSDPLITSHPEYLGLSSDAEWRQAAYRALFDEPLDEEVQQAIRDATNGGYALASEAFKRVVLAPRGYRIEPPAPHRPAKRPDALYAV